MDDNQLKEKDFQKYVGWETPLFIKIAWLGLLIFIVSYLVVNFIPAFREFMK